MSGESHSFDVVIREAVPNDAESVIDFMNQMSSQTDFLTQGEEGIGVTVEDESHHLASIYESENNSVIVALADDRMIGIATVSASSKPKVKHIGEVGIVIDKDFWGMGLGTLMVDELIYWSKTSSVIKRLELRVHEKNARAVALYKKMAFQEEAVIARGLNINEEYVKVIQMSLLV